MLYGTAWPGAMTRLRLARVLEVLRRLQWDSDGLCRYCAALGQDIDGNGDADTAHDSGCRVAQAIADLEWVIKGLGGPGGARELAAVAGCRQAAHNRRNEPE